MSSDFGNFATGYHPLMFKIFLKSSLMCQCHLPVMTLIGQIGLGKQCRSRSDCFKKAVWSGSGISLIRVFTVCYSICIILTKYQKVYTVEWFGLFVKILGGEQQRFLVSENLETLRYVITEENIEEQWKQWFRQIFICLSFLYIFKIFLVLKHITFNQFNTKSPLNSPFYSYKSGVHVCAWSC